MPASPVSLDDLDWVVDVLRRRRRALVPLAPVYWRPAPDADARHRAYLGHLLTEGGAHAWRTSSSVLVAARASDGWLVDDLAVDADAWSSDGRDLWNAFGDERTGDHVRVVCPTYELERARLADAAGLAITESWWLRELDGSGGGEAGIRVALPGAEAVAVAAPPVYAPPGPVLFLAAPDDLARAVPAAVAEAPRIGCAAVVVNRTRHHAEDETVLVDAGFRRHCDFYEGVVRRTGHRARTDTLRP